MADQLSELLQYLKLDTNTECKLVVLYNLIRQSGNEEGIENILKNKDVIQSVLSLLPDKSSEHIFRVVLILLVNLTSTELGAKEFLKYRDCDDQNVLNTFVGYVLDRELTNADAACMILSNVTRLEDELDFCIDIILPKINDLMNAFLNLEYNENAKLHYLSPIFSNLSRSYRIKDWLTQGAEPELLKLLPFINFKESNIRRGGAVGVIRNLSFSTDIHQLLLSDQVDLLTYLLAPLMGGEEYDDEEMEKLPITLQYLPKETSREPDEDIRKMILETLNRLCTKKICREILREKGVYYVLREYHKWEQDRVLLLSCENTVDILIRKEGEIGVDDLSTLDVTDEMREKFLKMDKDFVDNK